MSSNPRVSTDMPDGRARLWLGLTLLLGLALTGTYIYLDRACPSWDQAWYLQVATRLLYALCDGGPAAFVETYVHAFTTKAPLISVLPLPFFALFGPTEDAALLANLALMVVAQLAFYRLGAALYGRRRAVLAVALFSLFPLTVRLRHEVLVEYGLAALVLAYLYALWRSQGLRRRGWDVALGVVLGLGLLMKVSFPAYVLAPSLLVLAWRLRDNGRAAWRRMPLDVALTLLPGMLLAATWYAFNWRSILAFAHATSWGAIAKHYSLGPIFAPATIATYWREIINDGFSVYVTALAVALALAEAVARRRRAPLKREGLARPQTFVLAWFLAPLLLFTLAEDKALRFMLPALPPVALWLAGLIERLARRAGRQWLAPALLAVPLALAVYSVVPAEVSTYSLYLGQWALLPERDALHFYPSAPVCRACPNAQIIERVRQHPKPWPRLLVAVGTAALNHNNLSYAREVAGAEIAIYSSEPWPQGLSDDELIERLSEPDYIVMAEGIGPNWLNANVLSIRALIAEGRVPFVLLETYALPDGTPVRLYGRAAAPAEE